MDRFDRLQLFVRIVERRSFSAAAADLGLARSTVTEVIKQLEADLGASLLQRTTRHVAPTLDGEAFYQRCLGILADVEDAESIFRDAEPRGLLRIDAHPYLTQRFLLPKLPEFLQRYPHLDLQIGQGDRVVDLIREGVDCAIRAGELQDSDLIVRKLGTIAEVTCASPGYLERFGRPTHPQELTDHQCVGFISSRTGEVMPLEFMLDKKPVMIRVQSRVSVNDSGTMAELARLGFGIIQAPRYRLQTDLESGHLVEILSDYPPTPTPLSALYHRSRQLSPRLRVFLNWASDVFASANLGSPSPLRR
ncbi:LysR family transcriptional regulator [Rhizobium oryzicola]|uniref:LysR family transcriptional regulator n=1 Tax=Rhizobium oryzicola TaxID=1232668 RepID=A0ABT8SQI7_9HYPH|nr:LysR family transcriptional regulator [Rhizobium oryzicola]MDO1580724.1 LysR family transcriptional regulator [Rhizobium oryzicola]